MFRRPRGAWLDLVADWVFPRKCALCGRWDPSVICAECREGFMQASMPLMPMRDGDPLEWVVTPFRYGGRAGQAVQRLKFERITGLAAPLADLVAEEFESRQLLKEFDYVVPVPIHPRRRGERGFNQVEMLAEALPSSRVRLEMVRSRYTPPLYSQDRHERARLLLGAFEASSSVRGKSVILLDDIFTSGATMRECAKVLRTSGAQRVAGFALTVA